MLSPDDFTPAQREAITYLYDDSTLFVAPKGFGKAMVAQTVAQQLLNDDVVGRVLVAAPLRVVEMTWASEWKKWSHLEEVGLCIGSEINRTAVLEGPARIVVINFENLPWLLNTTARRQFDGLVIDESTKMKKPGGTTVKALRKHLKQFAWRLVMTADPVAEMGTDIYTQALLTDSGAALGRNQENFRRKYFYPLDFEQRRWRILPGMEKALSQALRDILYVAEDDGYEDSLPELLDVWVNVTMPPRAWTAYTALEQDGCATVDGVGIEVAGAAQLKLKQQQVTAGAIYDADNVAHWLHEAKFDALEAELSRAEGPVLVCYSYLFELERLRARWPDMVVLADDPGGLQDRWNAGELRYMALHWRSAAHGLNLQHGGHELIVLTPPWGADPWEQLVGRLRRRGQQSPYVKRTTLLVNETVDMQVMDRHPQKEYDSKTLNAAMADV